MARVLICGLGSIGRRHLRNLRALGVEDIVLVRTGKSTLPDEELKGMPVEADIETALKRHKPQAVIVSNPTALHLDVAIPAARAGCHLLIEKPVSHSLAGLEELRSAVRAGGGKVLIGFQFRFHPGLRLAKQMVDGGAIGTSDWATPATYTGIWDLVRDLFAATRLASERGLSLIHI